MKRPRSRCVRRGRNVRRRPGRGGPLRADAVVLALGHVPSRLNPEQRELQGAAEQLGLRYLPPAVPADVDWAAIPAGEPVLVRGMGLNFFDAMGQLTEGRGGKFVGNGAKLDYQPSGQEPLIIAASRRGPPTGPRRRSTGYYPASVTLRYLTDAALERFRPPGSGRVSTTTFGRCCTATRSGPLLNPGALAARRGPERPLSSPPSKRRCTRTPTALPSGRTQWQRPGRACGPAAPARPSGLAAPLAGRSFASRAQLDAAVVEYLLDDARRSALGEDDPVKMAIGALHRGRAVLKSAVADGGITDESWVAGLRGWFESFVEGLASGPPALRSEQLAALARAGVVSFVGPDPKFGVDRRNGRVHRRVPLGGRTARDGKDHGGGARPRQQGVRKRSAGA